MPPAQIVLEPAFALSIGAPNDEGDFLVKNSLVNDMVLRLGEGAEVTPENLRGDYTEFKFYLNPEEVEEGERKVSANIILGGMNGPTDAEPAEIWGDSQAAVERLHEVLMQSVAATQPQDQMQVEMIAGRKRRKTRKTRKTRKVKKVKKSTRRR